jgi:hypothetical protein
MKCRNPVPENLLEASLETIQAIETGEDIEDREAIEAI